MSVRATWAKVWALSCSRTPVPVHGVLISWQSLACTLLSATLVAPSALSSTAGAAASTDLECAVWKAAVLVRHRPVHPAACARVVRVLLSARCNAWQSRAFVFVQHHV